MIGQEKTLGEIRVRVDFNPDNNDLVSQIKQKSAELINLVESSKALDPRLAALAQTGYEEAAMWAVKLVTTPAVVSAAGDSGFQTEGQPAT